jgi:hypothetical protein
MNCLGEVTISTDVLTLGVRPNQYTFPTQAGEDGELLRSQDGNLIFGAGDHTLLTNTGITTHANLDAFKAGVEAMVDQDVRTLSTPSFASINTDTVNNAAGFRVVDKAITDVTHLHSGASPISLILDTTFAARWGALGSTTAVTTRPVTLTARKTGNSSKSQGSKRWA